MIAPIDSFFSRCPADPNIGLARAETRAFPRTEADVDCSADFCGFPGCQSLGDVRSLRGRPFAVAEIPRGKGHSTGSSIPLQSGMGPCGAVIPSERFRESCHQCRMNRPHLHPGSRKATCSDANTIRAACSLHSGMKPVRPYRIARRRYEGACGLVAGLVVSYTKS